MRKFLFLSIIYFLSSLSISAQSASIHGIVSSNSHPLEAATILLSPADQSTITDENGKFQLKGLSAGEYRLQIQSLGYIQKVIQVQLHQGQSLEQNIKLDRDVLQLEDIVVTATRNKIPANKAPVIVNKIDRRILDQTQSLSIAEGLNYSPGLRLENNCQNCGFTQVRMNGLSGPYTQILINSRPVFSALAGVYGLEMIPSNMVDRVEVVRGGGSALYGGNAIAGTVNIITKDPITNTYSFGSNIALIAGEALDQSFSANASIVDNELSKGFSFYAFRRNRDFWDANDDGFSEITLLENTTFGMDAFYNFSDRNRLDINLISMGEYRRGGNDFDLKPHQSDIAEELNHSIFSSNFSFDHFSKNRKHKWTLYSSQSFVDRGSYYGGGGRLLQANDTLTQQDMLAINAYGDSEDISIATGLQYSWEVSRQLQITTGSEYQYNKVSDQMPGYKRAIQQSVQIFGHYGQLEWQVTDEWMLLLGGRYDLLRIDGTYSLGKEQLQNSEDLSVFTPRASSLFQLLPDLKLRLSYARGYRGPQAFDEDLHIETVGGAALFTRLDPSLQTEMSHSYSSSLDYNGQAGLLQYNFIVDGFYTQLQHPFINSNQMELPNGISVITKRNGSGAFAKGVNLESNMAYSNILTLQAGATIQAAEYNEKEVIWSPTSLTDANRDSLIATNEILRTPNKYGYLSLNYTPALPAEFSISAVYTGQMTVPHVVNPDNEFTLLENTPEFLDINAKVSYEWPLSKDFYADIAVGVQNIFNSYQTDFDRGPDRDAGYIYGPIRPRTFFLSLQFHFEDHN